MKRNIDSDIIGSPFECQWVPPWTLNTWAETGNTGTGYLELDKSGGDKYNINFK